MKYIPVMGLEIHCELLTDSKMFCSCKNDFGGKPNSRVCPVCTGFPGMLPTVNKNAVRLAAKAGFATDCTVNNYSAFDRKNYFYPDSPKAYQITQFHRPICTNGHIRLSSGHNIRITQIHIEEDAGKLIHEDTISIADYNRCGVPLIEIVTAPDFRSAYDVVEFVRKIALRLKYAEVCDARMEQGSLRVDVNISLMPQDAEEFGTRAEIKNLNSLKAVERAIKYEIQRQSEILDNGGRVIQETRRFDEASEKTFSMRSKEEAHDYRYFPEPDIPPVVINDEELSLIKAELPVMPEERSYIYTNDYGLPREDAELITSSKAFSDFYDNAVKQYTNYKLISNIMLVDVNYQLNSQNLMIDAVKFTPNDISDLAKLCDNGRISRNAVKEILTIMTDNGGNPETIAQENGFIMSDNTSEIEAAVDDLITARPDAVTDYKNGNSKLFGFFMGQLVRKIGKSANPALVKKTLEERLNNYE